MAWLNNVKLPENFVVAQPPNVRRPHGYLRLCSIVEEHNTTWVRFNFEWEKVAKRVSYRLRNQLDYGKRYEFFIAGESLFIRLRPGNEPIPGVIANGPLRKNERAISQRGDRKTGVSSGAHEAEAEASKM